MIDYYNVTSAVKFNDMFSRDIAEYVIIWISFFIIYVKITKPMHLTAAKVISLIREKATEFIFCYRHPRKDQMRTRKFFRK